MLNLCKTTTQKIDKTKILMTNVSIMQVKSIAECFQGSILQYFWPALSDDWSWKPIFGQFESGRFTVIFVPLFCNAGQKYCRMLQGEHSAILLTRIKRLLILKNNFCHFESGRFTVILVPLFCWTRSDRRSLENRPNTSFHLCLPWLTSICHQSFSSVIRGAVWHMPISPSEMRKCDVLYRQMIECSFH